MIWMEYFYHKLKVNRGEFRSANISISDNGFSNVNGAAAVPHPC